MAEWQGLLGVVVGAFLAAALALLQQGVSRGHARTDRQRETARDDFLRNEQRRYEAYAALLTSANAVYATVKQGPGRPTVLANASVEMIVPEGGLADHFDQVHRAHDDLVRAMSPAFLLTTDPETREAIARVVRSGRELVEVGFIPDSDQSGHWSQVVLEGHRSAVKACEMAMREALGIV